MSFSAEGTGAAPATVTTLAVLSDRGPGGRRRPRRAAESFVGVVIALLVLLPETLAVTEAVQRNRLQTSRNLLLPRRDP